MDYINICQNGKELETLILITKIYRQDIGMGFGMEEYVIFMRKCVASYTKPTVIPLRREKVRMKVESTTWTGQRETCEEEKEETHTLNILPIFYF